MKMHAHKPSTKQRPTPRPERHALRHPAASRQRTAGNQAMQRLLEAGVVRPKLRIGAPGDPAEREADHIAERVMRMDPQVQRACECGGRCAKCLTRNAQEYEHFRIKGIGSSDWGQTAAPPIVHETLRSPGQPLEPETRAFMEPRIGHDFSQVRVHTDPRAADSARALHALAYTAGGDVVFGAGQYSMGSNQGRELIAHELTHVVQQGFTTQVIQRKAGSGLEQSATQAERNKLQVLTLEGVAKIDAKQLDDLFTGKKTTAPVDDIKFGTGIGAKLQPGLEGVAAEIMNDGSLHPNSVANLPLNLKTYGGVDGVYRFTFIQSATKPNKRLIVEQVSAAPPAMFTAKDAEAQQKRFDKFKFVFGAGFDADDKKHLLLAAIARVPDSVLSHITGVRFVLNEGAAGEKGEPALYNPNTHTIDIFGRALSTLQNSADAGGASFFTFTIAHEISHGTDFESFVQARLKRDEIQKQIAGIEKARRAEEVDVNKPIDDKSDKQKEKAVKAQIAKLRDDLEKANKQLSAQGSAEDLAEGGVRSRSNAFQQSKGEPISKLGQTANREDYAELLAMYTLDRDLLKLLRPKAYAYFAKEFK